MITLSMPSRPGSNWEVAGVALPGGHRCGLGRVPIEFRSGSLPFSPSGSRSALAGSVPRHERSGRAVCGTVWTPQVPSESRNLLSEPSRFGPSLVFVSVRMTNTRDSASPHGIPACQAAQLVVFWLERRASVVHRGDEHRVAVFWAGVRSLEEYLRPVPLAATRLCVPTTPTWHRRFAAGSLLSVPVLPLELHVFSTPRADCPIPLQARGVESTWSRRD
jgi:hypothetical protein